MTDAGVFFNQKAWDKLELAFARWGNQVAPYAQSAINRSMGSFQRDTWPEYVERQGVNSSARRGPGGRLFWFSKTQRPKRARTIEDVRGMLRRTSEATALMLEGGVVLPKHGKYMAIPLTEKSDRKKFRYGPGRQRRVIRNAGNPVDRLGIPRNWETYTRQAKGGGVFIFRRRVNKRSGKDTSYPIFQLVRRTYHRKLLDLGEALEKHGPEMLKRTEQEIDNFLRGKRPGFKG